MRTNRGERCDFMVEAEKSPRPYVYVIELKGSDLNKAITQIQSTIAEYREKLAGYKIMPRIIIHKTSTHDIQGKRYRDLKKQYPDTVVKTRLYDLDTV